MRARSRRRHAGPRLALLALLALLAATSGCLHRSGAPPGWLPTTDEVQTEAFGAWARVDVGLANATMQGELIAVSAESLFVLATGGLLGLSMGEVRNITVTAYDAGAGRMVRWVVLGAVSSLSHGVFLVLSLPTWGLLGSGFANWASRAGRVRTIRVEALRPYARFPAGIPPGLDRSALRTKTLVRLP